MSHTKTTGTTPTTNPDEEVANRIMDAIITRGTNLTQLSAATGINYSTLRRGIHQGRSSSRSFTVAELIAIAQALKAPASAFIPQDVAA